MTDILNMDIPIFFTSTLEYKDDLISYFKSLGDKITDRNIDFFFRRIVEEKSKDYYRLEHGRPIPIPCEERAKLFGETEEEQYTNAFNFFCKRTGMDGYEGDIRTKYKQLLEEGRRRCQYMNETLNL